MVYLVKLMCVVCCVCYIKTSDECMFICNNCEYKSCKKCCKKYFLISSKEPDCMNCGMILNKLDLIEHFGVKWNFGKYMKDRHIKNFQIQKHLLQSTKGDSDRKKKEDFIRKRRSELFIERKKINKELNNLKVELTQVRSVGKMDVNNGVLGVNNGVLGVNISEMDVKQDSNVLITVGSSNDSNDIITVRRFRSDSNAFITIRRFRCFNKCDGFLDEFYKCIVCSRRTCECCYSELNEGHYCIKQCPCCGVNMIKDDGCDLIKCFYCETFFDWSSGKIINKQVNNDIKNIYLPDFNKLNLLSFNDEDIITLRGMYDHIVEFIKLYKQKLIDKLKLYNNYDKMKNLRISYLINKINLIQFEKKINKTLKQSYYKIIITKIILSVYDKAINVFNNKTNYLKELKQIINKTNDVLINTTKYLKYKNNIKIHHWFNLDGIEILLK